MGRLVEIWRDRSGALSRLRDYASSGELDVQIEAYARLRHPTPPPWDGSEDEGGLTGWQRKTDEAVCSLAATMYELPTDEIAMRVFEADAETTAAGTKQSPPVDSTPCAATGCGEQAARHNPGKVGAVRGSRSSDAAVPRTRRRPEAGGLGSYSRATDRR